MQINFAKTVAELAPLQISDFIEVEFSEIKAVAAASNGEFIVDRITLPASEFLAKYFPDAEIADTTEKIEARRAIETAQAEKIKKMKARAPIIDQYGNYIVTLWESGDEFAASYRKTTSMLAQWNLLTKNEIEYKVDGRRFSVVYHTTSRKDALEKKAELIKEMIDRGLTNKGELPV